MPHVGKKPYIPRTEKPPDGPVEASAQAEVFIWPQINRSGTVDLGEVLVLALWLRRKTAAGQL